MPTKPQEENEKRGKHKVKRWRKKEKKAMQEATATDWKRKQRFLQETGAKNRGMEEGWNSENATRAQCEGKHSTTSKQTASVTGSNSWSTVKMTRRRGRRKEKPAVNESQSALQE